MVPLRSIAQATCSRRLATERRARWWPSVGQRQRAAIARALAHEPPIVIADEPTAAIDPLNAKRIVSLLVELVKELGVTLILATHDHDLVVRGGVTVLEHKVDTEDESAMTVTVSSA